MSSCGQIFVGFPPSSHGDGVVLTELSTGLGGQKPDFGAMQLMFELDPEHPGAVVLNCFSK